MCNKEKSKNKIKLAVFDFDGTLIPSQSGQKLAAYLVKRRKISVIKTIRLIFWGFRYKTHLPYRENLPRELIFSAFAGKDADKVNQFIDDFYEKNLDKTVRKQLLEHAEQIRKENIQLVVLSAAFTATLNSFAKRHGFDRIVGTQMEIDKNNCYTGNVEGHCVAGEHKIEYLEEFANKEFGKNNWEIDYAFADHYTDKKLLDRSKYACVVNPDDTLKRYAKKHDWEILEIED